MSERAQKPWLVPVLLGTVLAVAAAAAVALQFSSRARAVRDFERFQQHEIDEVAGVVEVGLEGAARTLRLLATANDRRGGSIESMIELETRCTTSPCAVSVSFFDADGRVTRSSRRQVALDEPQRIRAVAWAGQPVNAGHVLSLITHSVPPSLALIVPDDAGGFVAEELPFDVLFERTHGDRADTPYSLLIVSRDGRVLLRSGHPEMRLNNVFARDARCATCHDSLAHVDRMAAMTRGSLEYTSRAVPRVASVATIDFEGERWTAAAITPRAEVEGLAGAELAQLGALAAGTLVCLGLVARLAWREQNHGALVALNARLEQAAIEWRMTVDTIDAAVLVLDPDGAIERMNRVAADLLPGAAFSWLGQPSHTLRPHAPWDSALALAGEAVARNAVTMARVSEPRSGTTWDLWCRAPHRENHRHSVVIVARDVTALVELQASVRRSETMAALGLVVAGVAHEVRNPLFAISSLVDAWALRPQTPAPPHLIDALRREVLRLKTLMNELLEYGSPVTPEMEWHDLAPIVGEAVAAAGHDAGAHGVRIEASVPRDIRVWMDPRRLVRVFINLLQNAAQHAPDGTPITLTVRRSASADDELEISVRDRGRGFAAEDLPRVFTPFFSRRAGGFGLGLAICSRIVGEHGGRLSAANHPDGGAVLTVVLPLLAPTEVVDPAEGVEVC